MALSAHAQSKPAASPGERGDPEPVGEQVVAALGALIGRNADFRWDRLPPQLAEAFRKAHAVLTSFDEQNLARTVQFSMQASDAMAATARVTGEIRHADSKAQTIAAGVEELTASIDHIAGTAKTVAASMETANGAMSAGTKATRQAADASRNIGQSFGRMTGAADELAAAAKQIGTFVATIEGLSRQTNLLALNATIEAARAGEAGLGFAVVATEVKALSSQTQKATDDIRARIERLEQHVRDVVKAVAEVRGFVDHSVQQSDAANEQIACVRDSVAENTRHMAEIAGILDQQTQAVSEIARGVEAIAVRAKTAAGYTHEAIAAVSGSEKIINEQFAELEQRSIRNYVLHRAKSDHLLWKKRLSEMLVGLNSLKPAELSDHHSCRLGKWYDSVTDEALRRNPDFVRLAEPHEAVHRHGRKSADCHSSGDQAGALAALAEMEKASTSVLQGLDRLLS